MTVNDRYNVTKSKGHCLHLRELCRRFGYRIMYGFENVYLNEARYPYSQARPFLEARCQERRIPVDNRVDWP